MCLYGSEVYGWSNPQSNYYLSIEKIMKIVKNKTKGRSILWTLCLSLMIVLFFGCSPEDNTKDAYARLKVDRVNISVIQTGRLSSGSLPTLNVLANLGYEISSNVDWITPDKPTGKGNTIVTLNIEDNDTGSRRVGRLTVSSKELSEEVLVVQTMDPDTDDGKSPGFIYWEDDLSWCEEFGGVDEVENQATGSTIPIQTNVAAMAAFTTHGYIDINPASNSFYLAKNAFKMGKTNYQNGVKINGLPLIDEGKTSNVQLTFNATPVRTSSGNYDKVSVVVELEGQGSVAGGSGKQSSAISIQIPDGGPWYWVEKSVVLYGISADTKITIKTDKSGSDAGTFRWELSDIKIEKIRVD